MIEAKKAVAALGKKSKIDEEIMEQSTNDAAL